MERPVLLCFDGSEGAEDAIRRAGEVLDGGPAIVLHAWRPLLAGAFRHGPEVDLTDTLREAAEEMDQAGDKSAQVTARRGVELAREAGFEPVEGRTQTVSRSLWGCLVDVAREVDAEVIVVGAHGHARVKGALLGSVSAAVAHHADRPVLVVRADRRR